MGMGPPDSVRNEVFPFVVGHPRSGTTLLRAMLDAHPRLAIPPETYFAEWMSRHKRRFEDGGGFRTERFLKDLAQDYWFRLWGADERVMFDYVRAAAPTDLADALRSVYSAHAATQGKRLYGDKTPRYVKDIPTLAALFPEARFVHLIRDGRDVIVSSRAVRWSTDSTARASLQWKRLVRAGRSSGSELGVERYMEVRYEALVASAHETLDQVCAFLGLQFDPEMLTYTDKAESLAASFPSPEDHRSIALPPTKGLRDWRREMEPEEVAIFEGIAGDLLDELGYERSEVAPRPAARLRSVVGEGAAWTVYGVRKVHRLVARAIGAAPRWDVPE